MKNHPDRVQGAEAKQIATSKFSEISAAYELLTTKDNVGALHPSFAGAAEDNVPSYPRSQPQYPNFGAFGMFQQPFMNSFGMRYDPFGFGTFDDFHFTDPFELFKRTFGDINNDTMAFGTPYVARQPFQQSNMGMDAPGFGGFPSMFGNLGSIPMNGSGATFSSSSFSYGGTGAGGRMISTTTQMVNGRTVTRTEQTIINPDGTKNTVVLTGEGANDEKIPAITGGNTRKKESKCNKKLIGRQNQAHLGCENGSGAASSQTHNNQCKQNCSDKHIIKMTSQ